MDNKIVTLSKSVLYLTLSVLGLIAAFLAYNNPSLNYGLSERLAAVEQSEVEARNAKLEDWKWSNWSDVAVTNEKYPLVILRSGFKVLRVDKDTDKALVGWRMDILNTSKSSSYSPSVEYTIIDSDEFHVKSSSGSDPISKESFGKVQGTLTVSITDLDRLRSDTWTIRAGDWMTQEKTAKGKRYDRLAKLVGDKEKRPYWIDSLLDENNKYLTIAGKWKVIKDVVKPETAEAAEAVKKQLSGQ